MADRNRANRRAMNAGLYREFVKYGLSALILAVGGGIMYYLYTLAEPPKTADSDALIPLVGTFEALPYEGQLDMVVAGSVVPFREIKIASEVSGRVKVKHEACQAGSFVTKGTPLIEIDPEEYQLEIKRLEADVLQSQKLIQETEVEIRGAQRNVADAENEFAIQKRDFARNSRLQGVLSNSEIDQSERSLLASRSQLTGRKNALRTTQARKERLLASLELSRKQLEKAQLNLARTLIAAPDDGIIVSDMVEQGDYVNRGTQIVMFEDTRRAEVVCNLTASDLAWIRKHATGSEMDSQSPGGIMAAYRLPKTPVSIYETDSPEVVWNGILERFDGIGRDELTKSTPCRIIVEQPVVNVDSEQRALVRGMYVKCRIEVPTSTNAIGDEFLSFPEVALRPSDYIWIVRDRKLSKIKVDVVDRTTSTINNEVEPFVVIRLREDGLEIGDAVVITPLSQPTEGADVLLQEDMKDNKKPTNVNTEVDATATVEPQPTTS